MSTPTDLPEIRLDAARLYREEVVTDRQVGSIRKLVPIRVDGSDEPGREVVFEGQTSLLTSGGPLPLTFEIDARTLAEAVERFPSRAQSALEQTLAELETLRREAASSIIVPGRGGLDIGGLGGPGGGTIKMP